MNQMTSRPRPPRPDGTPTPRPIDLRKELFLLIAEFSLEVLKDDATKKNPEMVAAIAELIGKSGALENYLTR